MNKLHILENGEIVFPNRGNLTFGYREYCLSLNMASLREERGRYMVHVYPETEKPKTYLNIIFLGCSVVCLLVTLLVYFSSYKALVRNNIYNKIMLNFAGSLLMAFLILAIIRVGPNSYVFCQVFGRLNHYCFLATFFWMTIMSFNIFKQIRLNQMLKKGDTITRSLMVGYGVPAVIVCTMAIVEFSIEEECHDLKPKFGVDGECLFHGQLDKMVWLLGPILIMLIVNTFMFFYISIMVFLRQRKMTASRSGKSMREELLDKMILYLRLFFGMGIIWYFEVISFYVGGEWSTTTDIINMLQGVWVFLTFVCKRNVLQVVLRKRDRLYSIARQMTINKSAQNPLMRGESSETGKTRGTSLQNEEMSLSVLS